MNDLTKYILRRLSTIQGKVTRYRERLIKLSAEIKSHTYVPHDVYACLHGQNGTWEFKTTQVQLDTALMQERKLKRLAIKSKQVTYLRAQEIMELFGTVDYCFDVWTSSDDPSFKAKGLRALQGIEEWNIYGYEFSEEY